MQHIFKDNQDAVLRVVFGCSYLKTTFPSLHFESDVPYQSALATMHPEKTITKGCTAKFNLTCPRTVLIHTLVLKAKNLPVKFKSEQGGAKYFSTTTTRI
jgi:hypothetical protein